MNKHIPTAYPSMKNAARVTGIPLHVMTEAKNAGCPAFRQNHTFDLLPFLEWIFTRPENAQTDWQQHLTKHKALREENRYQKEKGILIEKQALADAYLAVFSEVLGKFEKLLTETLPPLTGNLSPAQVAETNRDHYRREIDIYRGVLDAKLATAEGAPVTIDDVNPPTKRAPKAEITRARRRPSAAKKAAKSK
jgi:hypothetical protein